MRSRIVLSGICKGVGKKTYFFFYLYLSIDATTIVCYNKLQKEMINLINLMQGDCLELMKDIPDGSIDMILADLPYGTTACKWDSIIPFEPLWEQYERVIKDNGVIVLTAQQPFTTKLIDSNIKRFKYCLIWDKVLHSNPLLAKKQPLRVYEDICVFYKKQPTYNPQMRQGEPYKKDYGKTHTTGTKGKTILKSNDNKSGLRYPNNIIRISNASKKNIVHPTQKPVPLFEYLIKTYTNEGETVLDNTMGSGTTGIACLNTNRHFIGIELDENYFKIAEERIKNHEREGQ